MRCRYSSGLLLALVLLLTSSGCDRQGRRTTIWHPSLGEGAPHTGASLFVRPRVNGSFYGLPPGTLGARVAVSRLDATGACFSVLERAADLERMAHEFVLETSEGDAGAPIVEVARHDTVAMMGTTVREVPTHTEKVCVEQDPGGDCLRWEDQVQTEAREEPMEREVQVREMSLCFDHPFEPRTEWMRLLLTPPLGSQLRFGWDFAQRCDASAASCPCPRGFGQDDGECLPVLPGDPETRSEAEVCAAWNAEVNDPSSWFVDAPTTCEPEALTDAVIEEALARINLHRWLSGTLPVRYASGNEEAWQQCAVIQAAAGSLDHHPPRTSRCYTPGGARAAGRSNLSLGTPSVAAAVTGQMRDNGAENALSLGHRRWLLGSTLASVQVGYSHGAACIGAMNEGPRGAEWAAYPNPGFAPMALFGVPWSFQSNFPLDGVQVTVTDGGAELPIRVYRPIKPSIGRQSSVAWEPQGWEAVPGHEYDVRITTSARRVEYVVKPTECDG